MSLGTFTMWLAERFSEMGLFRHLFNHVLGLRNFGNTKALRVIFWFKMLKFNLDFKNAGKVLEKAFYF